MAAPASQPAMRDFYLDIYNQQLTDKESPGPCIRIRIPGSTAISAELLASLKKLGNQLALLGAVNMSRDARSNYVVGRHLTEAEENEALQLQKRYEPLSDPNLKEVQWSCAWALKGCIQQGEVDKMRRVWEVAGAAMKNLGELRSC